MPKRIIELLRVVGVLLIGIVILGFLLKGKLNESITGEEKIPAYEMTGCKYPGRLVSIDDERENFIIDYKSECSLCRCNPEERSLNCESVLCPEKLERRENEE